MKITYENSLLQQILNLNKINKISTVYLNKDEFNEVRCELRDDYCVNLVVYYEDNLDLKCILLKTTEVHIMFKMEVA